MGGGRYDVFPPQSAVQAHGVSQLFWDVVSCMVGIVLSAVFHQQLRIHLVSVDQEI